MKKILLSILCLGLLVGCGAKETTTTEKEKTKEVAVSGYCDAEGKEFLDGYGETLEATFKSLDDMPDFADDQYEEYNTWHLENCLKHEADYVDSYLGVNLDDEDLQAAIEGLHNALTNMVEHYNDYGIDDEGHYTYYIEEGAYVRSEVLQYLIKNYNFRLPTYQSDLNFAAYIMEYNEVDDKIYEIFSEVIDNEEEDERWFGIGETKDGITVVNTTGYDLKNMSAYMVITYHDEDEEYSYVDSKVIELWKQGEEVTFEFDYGPQAFKSDINIIVYAIFANSDYEIVF